MDRYYGNLHGALHGTHLLPMHSARVDYLYGDQGPFLCGHCAHFIQPAACRLVAGQIDPHGCCNLYDSVEHAARKA